MGEWVSDWDCDCDWETMEGVGAERGRVDEFMVLLLSSIGGMTMCGVVDRRVMMSLRSHISLDGGAFYMHHHTV